MCINFDIIKVYGYIVNRNEKTKDFKLRRIPEKFAGIGRGLKVVADYNPDDAVDGTVVNAGATRVMIMESSEFPSEDESNLVRPYTESFHIIHPTYTYCSEDVKALPIQLTNWHEDDCDCPRDCESFNYRSVMMLGNLNALEQLVENP
ncbi:uncharacterized protein LOC123716508 [Pieris brassicae]|uniref:uncharacterized protein LOC123716508 n=1 Tax=Pieris brassicae TaxID=7116 RepID=UPI001E65F835|nr:uncharacterized protein LOC123716508 [Pieris brassicae]